MRRYFGAIGLSGFLALMVSGCGGNGFSGEIRVPVEQRHVLKAGSPSVDQIRLPGDRTFNIHLKTSNRDPGPVGKALSDSDASPDGSAFCEAQAGNGGTAAADFVIGHRIDNETATLQSTVIQVEFELQQEVRAPYHPEPQTLATGDLNILILDGLKRPIATVSAIQTNSDSAIGSSSNKYQFNLSAMFEPRQSYSMILQANVKAEADAGQEVFVRLAVRNLQMRLTFSPAPAESAPAGSPASGPAGK